MQKDNSTLPLKVSLRRKLLRLIDNPVVLETHGGFGTVWAQCYFDLSGGVVMEKDATKADALAKQRPTWAVYECDSAFALSHGVGSHLPINVFDIDPYGQCWLTLDAIMVGFSGKFPDVWAIVVNDGLRQKLMTSGSWSVQSLREIVEKYGDGYAYRNYLSVCQELVATKSASVGYTLAQWAGYYCGHDDNMTHFAAVLVRQ